MVVNREIFGEIEIQRLVASVGYRGLWAVACGLNVGWRYFTEGLMEQLSQLMGCH